MILRHEIMKELSVTIAVLHIPSTEIIITLHKWQNLPVLLCFLSASASSTFHKTRNNKLRCAQRRVYQRVQSQGRCIISCVDLNIPTDQIPRCLNCLPRHWLMYGEMIWIRKKFWVFLITNNMRTSELYITGTYTFVDTFCTVMKRRLPYLNSYTTWLD